MQLEEFLKVLSRGLCFPNWKLSSTIAEVGAFHFMHSVKLIVYSLLSSSFDVVQTARKDSRFPLAQCITLFYFVTVFRLTNCAIKES